MLPWSTIRMIPVLLLGVLLTWISDICHGKRPRSMDNFGPVWCDTHSQLRMECEYDRTAQRKCLPTALPRRRKRALTNPHELTRWQKTSRQDLALLLSKLPIELRRTVYMFVLRGSTPTLHIIQKTHMVPGRTMEHRAYRNRLGCWPCFRGPHVSLGNRTFPPYLYPPGCSGDLEHSRQSDHNRASYGSMLSLSLTCRQIYTETIEMLYSSHTFSMAETRMLRVFASTLLQQRLHSIQKLHLELPLPFKEIFMPIHTQETACSRHEAEELHELCRIVNGMIGLRVLLIDIFNLEKRHHKTLDTEKAILEPFLVIKSVENFVIRVSWSTMGYDDSSAPFRLVRPDNDLGQTRFYGRDSMGSSESQSVLPPDMV